MGKRKSDMSGMTGFASLSDDHLRILDLRSYGCTTEDIAAREHMSVSTVRGLFCYMRKRARVRADASLLDEYLKWLEV